MMSSSSSSFSATSSLLAANGALNQASKASVELNTDGRRKFSKAQSSVRLFWMGVPVSNRRCEAVYAAWSTVLSLDWWFFSLCPSSTTM